MVTCVGEEIGRVVVTESRYWTPNEAGVQVFGDLELVDDVTIAGICSRVPQRLQATKWIF